MAISTDWVNVSGLALTDIRNTADTKTVSLWDRDSVELISDAIGWERVCLGDYTQTLTIGSDTYPAENIHVMRPVDIQSEYTYGVLPYVKSNVMFGIVRLSTGEIVTKRNGTPALNNQVMVLRPSAQGCFCLKFSASNTTYYVTLDRFENLKTGAIQWGVICNFPNSINFVNLATVDMLNVSISTSVYNKASPDPSFFPYIALRKYLAISTAGLYVARTLYISYIDYAISERTVEVDGTRYRSIPEPFSIPLYIPLD